MTDRQVQSLVERIVGAAQPVPERHYHLCWWEGRIQCQHARHTPDVHEVVYSAPGHVFLDGLSEYQWRLAAGRIIDFCRTRGITLNPRSGRRQIVPAYPKPRRRLTEFDAMRLHGLLTNAAMSEFTPPAGVNNLRRVLESADVVKSQDIPADVVTMNSHVRLRNDDDAMETTLSLVFPADTRGPDVESPKLSVFTPTGASLLGRKVGDQVNRHLRILDLPYQPEAAGDFYL